MLNDELAGPIPLPESIMLLIPNLNAPQQSYEYTDNELHDEFHNIPVTEKTEGSVLITSSTYLLYVVYSNQTSRLHEASTFMDNT